MIFGFCISPSSYYKDEIRAAVRLIWERMKIIVEPSGAVPLAAVLSEEFRTLKGIQRVGVVLSGGSILINMASLADN